jgi:hypothetical protein
MTVWVFRSKSDPTAFAVTPNSAGSILPDFQDWELDCTATIDPGQARATGRFRGSEIEGWLRAFQKDGYCLLSHHPKGGVYFTEIENVSPADVEGIKDGK